MHREEFARHVKDALSNLYDPIYLQTHPLVGLSNLPRDPGETKGEALRKLLHEAVEALKPRISVPVTNSQWFGYRVLCLHYLRSLSQDATCKELNISRATFFRYQREALGAVVSVLWERYGPLSLSPGDDAADLANFSFPDKAMEQAISLVSSEAKELVDLRDLFEGVRQTIQPLADRQGVMLRMILPATLPSVYGHPTVFRQIFLSLLAEAIKFVLGAVLEITVTLGDHQMIWQLLGLTDLHLEQDSDKEGGFAISRKLLGLYGSRLWLERDTEGRVALLFALQIHRPQSILVIEDDPGAIALYRRYLQDDNLVLLGACTAEQVDVAVTETLPDLILLDVIMPRNDGWTILQHLKQTSLTAHIPVIICSVIAQPELALALGAAEVLSKPFLSEDLVRTVQTWLNRSDSREKAHQVWPSKV
jgi:CheY-like chemotaxis protein